MKIIIALLALISIFVLGCEGVDLSEVSEEDINKIIVCESPYIRHAAGCCLDEDSNDICDIDEEGRIEYIEDIGDDLENEMEDIDDLDEIKDIEDIEEISDDLENENIIATCISNSPSPITCLETQLTTEGKLRLVLGASNVFSAKVTSVTVILPVPTTIPVDENIDTTPSTIEVSRFWRENVYDEDRFEGDLYEGTATIQYRTREDTPSHTITISFSGAIEKLEDEIQEEELLLIPSICSAEAPFTCSDMKLESDGTLTLILTASGISDAATKDFRLTQPQEATCSTDSTISLIPQTVTCSFGLSLTQGENFEGTGNLTYINIDGSESHTITVQFSGSIE